MRIFSPRTGVRLSLILTAVSLLALSAPHAFGAADTGPTATICEISLTRRVISRVRESVGLPRYSAAEMRALRAYQGMSSQIRRLLEGSFQGDEETRQAWMDQITLIRSAMEKAERCTGELLLYRGELYDASRHQLEVGEVFESKHFTPTSIVRDVAWKFAANSISETRGGVLSTIKTTRPTKCISFGATRGLGQEAEVLLTDGLKFKIVSQHWETISWKPTLEPESDRRTYQILMRELELVSVDQ
jgi:hypothetical protein